jgi:hypothetical protein
MDDEEILELANELSSCFGHVNKDYEESLSFIENSIKHFNSVCHAKEEKINKFAIDKSN